MAWISGFVNFETPSEQQSYFEGNILVKKVNDLVFHGVVLESEGKTPAPGALVKVFARNIDGKEESFCQSFSCDDGRYLLDVEKEKIPAGTTAIIVRACADNHLPCTWQVLNGGSNTK